MDLWTQYKHSIDIMSPHRSKICPGDKWQTLWGQFVMSVLFDLNSLKTNQTCYNNSIADYLGNFGHNGSSIDMMAPHRSKLEQKWNTGTICIYLGTICNFGTLLA